MKNFRPYRRVRQAGAAGPHVRSNSGIVFVLALVFLVLFGSLSVALISATTLNQKMGENQSHSLAARMAAEGGLSWMLWQLDKVTMPAETTEDTLISNLSDSLSATLNGTVNLCGQVVSNTGATILVPSVTLDHGSFSCVLTIVPDGQGGQRCRLTVTGTRSGAKCDVSMDFDVTIKRAWVFDYGIASRGRIVVTGNALIEGVNDPADGSVLSTRSEPVAIETGGHATITGDLYITGNDPNYISLTGGGFTIGGESDPDLILQNHVHVDVDAPDFPVVDITPFEGLTRSIIDSNTNLTGSGLTFNNARILAGTNPAFHNHTVINGVLFIEVPNVVTFNAGTTINGVIVTEDASGLDIEDNQIDFKGHVTAPGVDALPDDDPNFAAIKLLTGTVVLAPGFGLTMRGSSNTINGTIAAAQLTFTGGSGVDGYLTGTIIGLANAEMSLHGSTSLHLSRSSSTTPPAGFKHPVGLTPNPGTYCEGAAN